MLLYVLLCFIGSILLLCLFKGFFALVIDLLVSFVSWLAVSNWFLMNLERVFGIVGCVACGGVVGVVGDSLVFGDGGV